MKKTWSTNSFEWIAIEQLFKSSIQQKGFMLNQTSNQIYLKSTYLFIFISNSTTTNVINRRLKYQF